VINALQLAGLPVVKRLSYSRTALLAEKEKARKAAQRRRQSLGGRDHLEFSATDIR